MKIFLAITTLLIASISLSQSYAPAAGQEGSTAIAYNDPIFVGWATDIEVRRGFINIEDTTAQYEGSNKATFGEPEWALGPATNITTDVVSLGDSGIAIVTFANPITNGSGFDFAIFENGLQDDFLELAHVEVSSDGINFVRFSSHSEIQTETQISSFGSVNPTYLNNLAGKYRIGFGTPFDLEELKNEPNLDINHITHVKIIDAIGTIGEKGTVDSYGNKINDLFPTPFNSGGFDLNAVGVIHEKNSLSIQKEEFNFNIYPNPSKGIINLYWNNGQIEEIVILNTLGEQIFVEKNINTPSYQIELPKGMYFVRIKGGEIITRKVVVD